jgi:hypothetical protein
MTMTRETKVGVVVCLSFLCLVGVVLGTKLRGDGSEEDDSAKEEVIADARPPAVGEKAPPPAMRIPIQSGDPTGPDVISIGAVQDAQPLPPPPSSVLQQRNNETASPAANSDLPPPLNNGRPGTQATPSGADIVGSQAGSSQDTSLGTIPKAADVVELPIWRGIKVQIAPTGGIAAGAISSGVGTVSDLDDAPEPDPTPDSKESAVRTSPVLAEQPASLQVQPGAPPAGAPGSGKPDDVRLVVTPPPPVSLRDQSGGSQPSAVLLRPLPPSGAASRNDSDTPGVTPDRSQLDPAAVDSAARPPQPSSQVVPVSAVDSPRPIGAAPTATTPAITVPVPGGGVSPRPTAPVTPQVESWDEETYRIKAGDNFARISAAHYNTDKYAKALERFNVNHPQAGEHMRSDPPRLEPGQLVYIPPTYILEKRYGKAFIPGYQPQPETGAAGDAPRTVKSSPRGESAGDSAKDFKWYLVPPGGQMMRDISRVTLSDAGRWTDISKLNPKTDPSYAVPGGLLIKVPADARIPAGSMPQAESR